MKKKKPREIQSLVQEAQPVSRGLESRSASPHAGSRLWERARGLLDRAAPGQHCTRRGLDVQEIKGTGSSKFSTEKVPRRWGPMRRIFKGLQRSPARRDTGQMSSRPLCRRWAACCSPPRAGGTAASGSRKPRERSEHTQGDAENSCPGEVQGRRAGCEGQSVSPPFLPWSLPVAAEKTMNPRGKQKTAWRITTLGSEGPIAKQLEWGREKTVGFSQSRWSSVQRQSVLPIIGDDTFVRIKKCNSRGTFFPRKRDCKDNINLFKLKTWNWYHAFSAF